MIRAMEETDLPEVLEIENESFGKEAWTAHDFLYEMNENPFGRMVVYEEENGEITGYMGYWDYDDRAEITNLAVRNDKRRKGIASRLLAWMTELGADGDWENITLEVREKNERAIALYRKFGFEILARKRNYYGAEDGYLMGRKLER